MKKTGLILEGGGTRGVFTSGVLDYLMEKQIYFPYVAGVSCGSCNAVDYVSGQIGRTKECMILSKPGDSYMGLQYFLKSRNYIDMDRIFDKFPNEEIPFDYDAYFASDIRCEMVATNCLTGEAEYLEEKSDRQRLMQICRASSSLPLISQITEVDGIPYLDGGVGDSIPIRRSLKLGYKKNVIILTRNAGYRKGNNRHTDRLCQIKYREYPNLVKAILRRPHVYNKTLELIERLESEGHVFVLRPQIPPVSRTENNRESLTAFYNHGYEYMKNEYGRLMEYMERA